MAPKDRELAQKGDISGKQSATYGFLTELFAMASWAGVTAPQAEARQRPLEGTTRGFLFLFEPSFFFFFFLSRLVNPVFSAVKIYIVFPKDLPVVNDY